MKFNYYYRGNLIISSLYILFLVTIIKFDERISLCYYIDWIFLSPPSPPAFKVEKTFSNLEQHPSSQVQQNWTKQSFKNPWIGQSSNSSEIFSRENRHHVDREHPPPLPQLFPPPDATSRLFFPFKPFQKFLQRDFSLLFFFSFFPRHQKFPNIRNVRKSIIRGQRFFFRRLIRLPKCP